MKQMQTSWFKIQQSPVSKQENFVAIGSDLCLKNHCHDEWMQDVPSAHRAATTFNYGRS